MPFACTRSRTPVGLVGQLAVDAVLHQLGVAEDGVERRAQLVAHVGEELRLVLAGDLELPALLLDLAEQPRVLDRERRLAGEGLHQVDDARRELAGPLAQDGERAEHAVWPRSAARSARR